MAGSEGGKRLQFSNPLLTSSKLTSKFLSPDKKLSSHGSPGFSSQLSHIQSSVLSRTESQKDQSSTLTRTVSHKSDKMALSSSSASSLTSSSDLSKSTSTRSSQLIGKGTGDKLSGQPANLKPSLHAKSELTAGRNTSSLLMSSKSSLLKSSVPLTGFTTASSTPASSASGKKSTVASTSAKSSTTSRASAKGSTAPSTSLKGYTGLTGQKTALGRSNLLTFTDASKTSHTFSTSSSLKPAHLLPTSTSKLSTTSSSLVSRQLVSSKTLTGASHSSVRPTLLSSRLNTSQSSTSFNTQPLRALGGQTTLTKPLTTLTQSSKALNAQTTPSQPPKGLSTQSSLTAKTPSLPQSQFLAKSSINTTSSGLTKSAGLSSSRQLQDNKGPQDSAPASIASVLTKPVTEDTEGAPTYDFSSSAQTHTAARKKQLFVSPELDASIQAPSTPALDITGLKVTLLNAVATSLLCSPDFRNPKDPTHQALLSLGEKLSSHDPEFLLKLSLYTRTNLNIRTTANFLLALAAKLPPCRPYLRKYFSSTVKLPSDWIEVAEIYQSFQDEKIKSGAIPTALRKAMSSKFTTFDAYQLGKYNKDSSKKKKKNKPTKAEREKKKAEKLEQDRKEKYDQNFPVLQDSDSDSESESSLSVSGSEDEKEIERLSFTLKQLIRKIHISEPVEYVMCLVGKKYPEDPEAFRKSRLQGVWDQDRAGKRMKLPTPETWETQVSTKGNKASTWQDLIDHKKLPFMAMLRNIRNLILAGVSSKHHQWVIRKLNDEYAVVNSKQFPFRFFSAYEVLGGLEKIARGEQPPTRPPKRGQKKPKKVKELPEVDTNLLQKYKTALDSALKIATCYNVKPISGTTLILCNVGKNMDRPCTAARGLGKPRKVVEVGVLLGLMCKYSCEHSTMLLYGQENHHTEVSLEEGTILHNMDRVMSAAGALSASDGFIPLTFLTNLLLDRTHVDNIVLLTDAMKLDDQQGRDMMDYLKKYRHFVNPDLLFVSVDLSGRNSGISSTITPEHPNDIYLAGYSDQILRFIAERGDSGQLTYVENIDKVFNLSGIKPPSLGESASTEDTSKHLSLSSEKLLLSTAQGQRWRTVRVFISSTFRDMHGERDLLTRFVFPELRARAHSRQIHVYEVDLRWGVTETDARSHKAMEICLQEISRSQYFIGLLGQRYGWIQDEYQFPDTPEFDWLKEYPPRRSITEIEMYHAALHDTDKAVDKAFFYFRDSSFLEKVPKHHRAEFESESEEAQEKMEALKSDIFTSGLEVYNNYPCRWLGEVQNKPMVGGLEQFGERVLYSLWNAIQRDYPEEELNQDAITQAAAHHTAFQDSRASTFIGRRVLLQKAREIIDHPDNQLVVVTGKAGCGKSAFMAALAQDYTANSHKKLAMDLVIPHFIGAAPGSANIAQLLTRLCHEMKRRFEVSRDIPDDYTDLVREWQNFLEDSCTNLGKVSSKIIILIDGVDLLEDKHNGRALDWIPEEIPDGVVLLLSGVEGGTGVTNLRKRKPSPAQITVGGLDMFDKAEMVRKKLQKHRKTLEESAFNNQMKLLLTKKEATNPLFLHLACEELRVFGIFEEVTSFLKGLPTTTSGLLQGILERLELEHTSEILSTAMIMLTLVRNGLLEYELTRTLDLALNELYPDPDSERSLPPMAVSKLLRSLQTFLQPTGQESEDLLTLAHKDIEKAVRLRYTRGTASKKESELHLLLATFFQAEADPNGDLTFKGNSTRAFTELPYHLTEAGAWRELEEILCNINFVIAKCQLGLAHELLEDYSPVTAGLTAAKSRELAKFIQQPTIQEYKSFVSRNLHILLKTPSLALQQALNEPRSSKVATASSQVQQDSHTPTMMWVNRPEDVDPCQMNIASQTGAVLCVAVSPDSSLFAAGHKNGAVKVYHVATGKEAHTFIGHAAGVAAVCFVGNSSVCSASHDTTLSLWDTSKGIRLTTLKGHTRGVHGCSADKAGKSIVSVSWDTSIKVWEGRTGKITATLKTPGQRNTPINCVSFHPEGQLVVAGSWDSTLKIWDTFNQKKLKVLRGHKSSIQACAYAPSGRHIVSAALDGEVKVWATKSGTAVGSIVGHHSPVKGIAFTPNGQFLATASSDKTIKMWSGSLGQPISSLGSADMGFVHKLAFNYEAQSVSVGYHNGHIRQFNIQTGVEVAPAAKPHSAPVLGLAHHGKLHMAAFADGTIKVCELTALPVCVELRGHTSALTCAVWGRKGFASASDDFSILMWPHDIQSYSRLLQGKTVSSKPARLSKKKRGKAVTPPQPVAETNESQTEKVVKPLATIRTQHTGKITSISFSCDGNKMAVASHDKDVSIWSCFDQQLLKVLSSCHKDWVTACCFSDTSPDILITGSTDFTLKVWDTNTGKDKSTFKGHTSAINSVTVSQGCVVSGAFDGSVKVWTHKGVEITTMFCHKQRVNTCLLHVPTAAKASDVMASWADIEEESNEPKSKMKLDEILVLTGSDDGTVGVWKPFLPNEILSLIGHSDQVLSVSTTLNNQLISSSTDGTVRVWGPALPSAPLGHLTLNTSTRGHTGPVTSLSASCVGQDVVLVVSGGRDGHLKVWEMGTEAVTQLSQTRHSDKAVGAVCWTGAQNNQSGSFIAGDDSGLVTSYTFNKGAVPKELNQFSLKPHPISKLVLSSDRKNVLAGSWSNKLAFLDLAKKSFTMMGGYQAWVMDLVVLRDKLYYITLDNTLHHSTISSGGILSATSKVSLRLKQDGEEGNVWPLSLCEVQGTNYLVISDNVGKVHLWNRVTQHIEVCKKLHGKQINVVCSLSKNCFVTGSDDCTVKVWLVEGKGQSAKVTQMGQFYCQACVTTTTPVKEEGKKKAMLVVGDSLGHVSLLQWLPTN